MDLEPHRQQVLHALSTLETRLERLTESLAHDPNWVRVDGASTDREALRRICAAYAAIDYDMEDAANESVVCLGVIGVSAEVLRRAEAVNAAKAALKTVCAPLQRVRMRVPVKGESGPTKAIPVIRVILRSVQRSDLNLLAAYRRIPILGARPTSITYTRARTRAVYRKTVDEIQTLLMNMEVPDAQKDRARLASLSPAERHLALARDHYENIRANVVYEHLDKRGRGRVQLGAELPLLYAQGRHPSAPEIHFPDAAEAGEGVTPRARQSKLQPLPFLQSLPVYRYIRTG